MDGWLIWITGLAGSGKTTLAQKLYRKLKADHSHTVHLDGDSMREILGSTYGHSIEDRKTTANIYCRLAAELTSQGINVIVSTMSLFHAIHDYNREHNTKYLEVLLEVDTETLSKRRELYKDSKNVMGKDQKPEFPKNPDLTLENDSHEKLEENVRAILAKIT